MILFMTMTMVSIIERVGLLWRHLEKEARGLMVKFHPPYSGLLLDGFRDVARLDKREGVFISFKIYLFSSLFDIWRMCYLRVYPGVSSLIS